MWFIISIFLIRCFLSFFSKRLWLAGFISMAIYIVLMVFGFNCKESDYLQIGSTLLCANFVVIGYYLAKLDIFKNNYLPIYKQLICIAVSSAFFVCIGLFNYFKASDVTYGGINVFRCVTGFNIILFWLVAVVLSYNFLKFIETFMTAKHKVVETISQGTIVILCLHQLVVNILTERWGETSCISSLVISLFTMLVSYPIVKLSMRHCPILIGKKNSYIRKAE